MDAGHAVAKSLICNCNSIKIEVRPQAKLIKRVLGQKNQSHHLHKVEPPSVWDLLVVNS